jgi:hypothetical protein
MKIKEKENRIKAKCYDRPVVLNLFKAATKPGGLDSRDQSRSRLSLVPRPNFETCRDYPYYQDKIIFFLS